MKNSISFLLNSAEYFLVLAVLVYWHGTSNLLNPIAIGLLAVLIFQIIFRNKVIGILIPCVLMLLSMYMIIIYRTRLFSWNDFDFVFNDMEVFAKIKQ